MFPLPDKEFYKDDDYLHDDDKPKFQSKKDATTEHIMIGGGSIGKSEKQFLYPLFCIVLPSLTATAQVPSLVCAF